MTPRAYTRKRFVLSDNWRMVFIAGFLSLQTIGVAYIAVIVPSRAQVAEVHELVNSVSVKLATEEKAKARAEGRLEGEADERARTEKSP